MTASDVCGVALGGVFVLALASQRYPKRLLRLNFFGLFLVVATLLGVLLFGFPAVAVSWGVGVAVLLLGVFVFTKVSLKIVEGVTVSLFLTPWWLWWVPLVAFLVVGVVSAVKIFRVGGKEYFLLIVSETLGALLYGVVPKKLFRRGPTVVTPDLSRLPFPSKGADRGDDENETLLEPYSSNDDNCATVSDSERGNVSDEAILSRIRRASQTKMNVLRWYGVGVIFATVVATVSIYA